jgi:hypothetical protein
VLTRGDDPPEPPARGGGGGGGGGGAAAGPPPRRPPPAPPGPGPVRQPRRVVRHRTVGPEQQQGQYVLARELPAGTGAPVRRAGQVDHGAVRCGGAAAALAPHRVGFSGGTGRRPGAAGRQRMGGPLRRRVGCQGKYSLAIPAFGHARNLSLWY